LYTMICGGMVRHGFTYHLLNGQLNPYLHLMKWTWRRGKSAYRQLCNTSSLLYRMISSLTFLA
jgi:hypothetical protein